MSKINHSTSTSRSLSKSDLRFRHHIRIRRRIGHHKRIFLKRTVAAQIHAWAAVGCFIAMLILCVLSYDLGVSRVVSMVIFGASSVLLFSSSALMHFLTDGYRISKTFEKLLENFDKISIHLLIAGTYTAVMEVALTDPLKTRMLISVWAFALVGIFYTILFERLPKVFQSRILYTSQFLVMGWLVVFCMKELFNSLTFIQMICAIVGGVLYSIGAVIYAFKHPNPTKYFGYHEIWHSLVVLGCASFYLLVFLGLA